MNYFNISQIRILIVGMALTCLSSLVFGQDVNSYFSPSGLYLDHVIGQRVGSYDRSRVSILDNRIQIQSVRTQQFSASTRKEYPVININTLDSDANLLGFSYKDETVPPGQEQQFFFLSGFDGVQGSNNKLFLRTSAGNSLLTFAPFTNASRIFNRIGVNDTTPEYALDINGDIQVDNRIIGFLETAEGNDLYFNTTPNRTTGAGFMGASINVIVNGEKQGGAWFWSNKNFGDPAKTFIIQHPIKPDYYLIHAAMEGPEAAVFYRGKGKLQDGQATIQLPRYFESLTHKEGRTISLTSLGENPIMVKSHNGTVIQQGAFRVLSKNATDSSFFYWEVKAVRKDIDSFEIEPKKAEVTVKGMGPYRFIEPNSKGNNP